MIASLKFSIMQSMEIIMEPLNALLSDLANTPPAGLALILGLAAIGLAAFAIYVVHSVV